MSNGGDWNSSDNRDLDPDPPTRRAPERAVVRDESLPQPGQTAKAVTDAKTDRTLNLFATIAIGLLGAGIAVVLFLIQDTGADGARFVPEDARPAAPRPKTKPDRTSEHERDAARRESVQSLEKQLTQAAWGDFDSIKRDELARALVALSSETQPIRDLETILHRAGAWDVLMETPPPHQTPWFDVHIRLAHWDRLLAMDSTSANEPYGTRALCLAGDEANALRVYEHQFKSALESPDGIACGLNSQNAGRLFRGLSVPPRSIGLAASRNAVDLRLLFERITSDSKNRNASAVMDVAALLYLDGKLSEQKMAEWASRGAHHCESLPRGGEAESVAPSVLFTAADKLAASKLPVELKTRAIENLNIGGVLAGHFRREDTRRDFKITTPKNEICMAQVEYEFEPKAAIKRLARLKSEETDAGIELMWAMATAHIGDFEAAFQHATNARTTAKPHSLASWHADWVMMAMAHRLGRLDQMTTTPNPAQPKVQALLQADVAITLAALQGTKTLTPDQFSEFDGKSLNLPLEVVFYLRGALAPGHEETAADGLVDVRSPVSSYLRARAEAANWRGDVEAAKIWSDRRDALHLRAAEGKFGGHHLLWTR